VSEDHRKVEVEAKVEESNAFYELNLSLNLGLASKGLPPERKFGNIEGPVKPSTVNRWAMVTNTRWRGAYA
jgi:hypothetical protein